MNRSRLFLTFLLSALLLFTLAACADNSGTGSNTGNTGNDNTTAPVIENSGDDSGPQPTDDSDQGPVDGSNSSTLTDTMTNTEGMTGTNGITGTEGTTP